MEFKFFYFKKMNKKLLVIAIFILFLGVATLFFFNSLKECQTTREYENQEKEKSLTWITEKGKTDLIGLFFPQEGDAIESPLIVSGEARGFWFFEADFPVILTNWDGLIIAESIASAQSDWMTENYVSFEAELVFENPVFPGAEEEHFSRRGFLILQKDNPSGLPEHDDALEISIRFK